MDLSALPGLWSLTPFGAILGMLTTFFFLLARGAIITRSSHERELAQSDKRGDEWKETALSKDAVNNELLRQNGLLIGSAERSVHSTPVAEQTVQNPSGGPNVV